MATPYLDEAERCGRVLLLHEGRVLAIDAPAALQASLAGRLFEVIAADGASAARGRCARVPGVPDAQGFGDRAHVTFAARTRAAIRPGDPRRRWRATGLT